MSALQLVLAAVSLPLILAQGCPGIVVNLPATSDGTTEIEIINPGIVRVEVLNDTSYEVEPRIRFDDDSSWWAQLFPAETLATGTLAPGDYLRYDIACDRVGLVFSDSAGQFLPGALYPIGQAEPTRVLTRDDDYDCGNVILFQFIGDGASFGVIVSVNNVVVD